MRVYRSFLAALMLAVAAACASAPEPAIPFSDRLAAAEAAPNPYQTDAALTALLVLAPLGLALLFILKMKNTGEM